MVTHRRKKSYECRQLCRRLSAEGSDASLDIGGAKFFLFTKKDSACRDPELDKTIVEAMAKGKQAIVKGIRKGQPTTDTTRLPVARPWR
jgi:hypothetical protein